MLIADKPMSKNETTASTQRLKRDLAAAYRLMALKGLDDLTDGFVSTRAPENAGHVLIGKYGVLPEQARASDMVCVRLQADPPIVHFEGADVDALLFSLAVYETDSAYNAVIHAHPRSAVMFAGMNVEIEPISQAGVMFYQKTRSIAFDENVSNAGVREQIGDAIADGAKAIIMENHGLIVPGQSIPDAFIRLYRLNQAIEIQLGAMAAGAPLRRVDMSQVEKWSDEYWRNGLVHNDGTREWPAFLELLRQSNADFEL
ncbi:MAG: class II aldolase/adducin family protein [Pseudomonadota bacterium]